MLTKNFNVKKEDFGDTHMAVLHALLVEEGQTLVSFAVRINGQNLADMVQKLGLGDKPIAVTGLGKYGKAVEEELVVFILDKFNSVQVNQGFEYDKDRGISVPYCVDIEFLGNNRELADQLLKVLGAIKEPPVDNKGSISVLIQTQSGLDAVSVGKAAVEWIPSNYTEENIKDVELMVRELNKKTPAGRIVILDGSPGTGKSTLVRAIVTRIPKAHFIIIPANMVSSLGDPSFMGFFLNASHLHDSPIVLVIEDGDYCLVPRGADNISAISTLLNITDGIVGQMLDIRVIITTNVRCNDIDEAVMRPGRLLKQISFYALSVEQSNAVFKRITGKEGSFTGPKTLAEIYVSTKDDIPVTPKKKTAKMGFG